MSNAGATTTERNMTPVAAFRGNLDKMRDDISAVLPRHVSFDRFRRVVLTAVQQQPTILDCIPKTVFASCLQCAKDGLIPDGREAALVVFKGKSGATCQYMPMVNGLIKLARQSGEISTLTAQIVYEKDRFELDLASDTRPTHEPFLDGDRGKFRIAYALAVFRDGTHQLEVMTKADIEKIRNISRAKDNGPWKDHWNEMARKTVLRRLMKYLSLSPELANAIAADDSTYDLTIAAREERASLPTSLNDDFAPAALEAPEPEAEVDAVELLEPQAAAEMLMEAKTATELTEAWEQIEMSLPSYPEHQVASLIELRNDRADDLTEAV
jgi:recombination protein RecT